jgi:hypothetical protein
MKTKKRPAFKRKQYRLNWLQILRKMELAQKQYDEGNGVARYTLTEAIDALRERLGLPVTT